MVEIGDDYIYGYEIRDAMSNLENLLDDDDLDPDEREGYEEEMQAWVDFASQARSTTDDWDDETYISDSVFAEHAWELARDLHGADMDTWPFTHIDWEEAGDTLKGDYTEIDVNGTTYWVRS